MTALEPVPAPDPDEEIARRVLDLLDQATVELARHRSRKDYHYTLRDMAAGHIRDAHSLIARLNGPIPTPYRHVEPGGPEARYESGHRRYRVKVTVDRTWQDGTGTPITPEQVKKMERAKFYDDSYAAAREAKSYEFIIGKWAKIVEVHDRLNGTIWRLDGDGNWTELLPGDDGPDLASYVVGQVLP